MDSGEWAVRKGNERYFKEIYHYFPLPFVVISLHDDQSYEHNSLGDQQQSARK